MNSNIIRFRLLLAILFVLGFASATFAAGWDVPADKKAKNSNIKFDKASASEGEGIYTKNCLSCHGNPGKGNMMKSLNPIPPDLSAAQTQALTDGELQYILAVGRGLMPSFQNVMSESDRWKIISYLRSSNKNYVQVISKTDPAKSELVKIKTSYDNQKNKVNVLVTANEKTGVVVLKGAQVSLFAKRYFGNLQIEKQIVTDPNGIATFTFPTDLPGDKEGTVDLVVKVSDDVYGEIESVSSFKIGVPTNLPGLTEKRAMWNVVTKAPIWLILTYLSGVLIVSACLIYVLLSLFKLKNSK